jgi:hypothetical protein
MKTRMVLLAAVGVLMFTGFAVIPAYAVASELFYFQFNGSACTTTAVTDVQTDGQPSGELVNNVGGPPTTAVLGNGLSVCLQVSLVGAAANTAYSFSSNGATGSCSFTTDGSGDGVSPNCQFTGKTGGSSTSCITAPIKISPAIPGGSPSGQIGHFILGDANGLGGCTGGGSGVPEFPLGPTLLFALAIPGLLLFRRRFVRS